MMFARMAVILSAFLWRYLIIDRVESFALDPNHCQERGGQSSWIHQHPSGAFPLPQIIKIKTSSRNTKVSKPRHYQTTLTAINNDYNNKSNEKFFVDDVYDDGNNDSMNTVDGSKKDKFSFYQRIESTKTALVGLLSGGVVSTPIIALHDIPNYGLASWEFDTDMGSLQSALFAIVYRYCIRQNDDNVMLNMGVVGAFIFVRTLARMRVPSYCTAAPLDCGDPLGYFDYDMIGQLIFNGMESVALFGGAAYAMEVAYGKGWITKFPS